STILFDKTGTLTKGKPEVTDIIGIELDEKDLLEIAASVEKNSEHPLAEAIVKKADLEKVKLQKSSGFTSFGGKGVKALLDDKEIIIGNRVLFEENEISLKPELEKNLLKLENEGKTAIIIGSPQKIWGIIAVAD